MTFVVDRNIPLALEAFSQMGDVVRLATTDITPVAVRNADVLVVRSETRVNRSLLAGSRVGFVGTTTIGTDHVDLDYLASCGIAFASAPGCNANAVKEYFAAAMLHLTSKFNLTLRGKTLGIIGVGNVGNKIREAARLLGMKAFLNDPPRARKEGPEGFADIEDLMDCDIITLHTPLTTTGQDPTFHLFDGERFARLKPGTIFVNTSRGAVADTTALKAAIRNSHLSYAILDVWENEPQIDTELLSMVTLGTPHIAGYSYEGKVTGLRMVHRAICGHFGISSSWNPSSFDDAATSLQTSGFDRKLTDEQFLCSVIRTAYDVTGDDADLRRMPQDPRDTGKAYFMKLRSGYRMRREFPAFSVSLPPDRRHLLATLTGLGFRSDT